MIHLQKKNLPKALDFAHLAYKVSKNSGKIENIANVAKLLNDIYTKQNQQDKAIKFFKEYIVIRDSISNLEEEHASLDSNFEFEFSD